MAADADLDRLADLLGIEPWYDDIWGDRRDIGSATRRDLARAMGYPADTPGQTADSLRRIEEAPWRRTVTPIAILDEGGYAAVEVVLPEGAGGAGWWIGLEDGREVSGGSPAAHMEWLETRLLDGRRLERRRLPLAQDLPPGYHRLRITAPLEGEASLVVAPRRCLMPGELAPGELKPCRRLWGFGVQLYGLKRDDDWGIGDFGDLERFADITAGLGADAVGLNPLHALFPADPNHASPYSPSNRGFLNILHIDPRPFLKGGAAAAALADPGRVRRLAAVRGEAFVDYPAVAALKMPILEAAFADFLETGPEEERTGFAAFRAAEGEPLERQALFDALHEHFYRGEGIWNWHDWPEPYRRPDSAEVRDFARSAAGRVDFFAWAQFVADRQLGRASAAARGAGMALGFYRDLAVADHPDGAAAWADPEVVLAGAKVGAPPDMFSPKGQNWGLAPLSPVGLLERAYRPFIAGLRANMRHAGALRIDHAMALRHLFWIPSRPDHEGGAYVRYPERDLMRLIALESHRNRCAVIGEALGTVPEGFPRALDEAGILSYKVLYFERTPNGGFAPPSAYPAQSLVAVTTHDLPTLRGWWTGHDQELRLRLGLYADETAYGREKAERVADRERLFEALCAAGLVAPGAEVPDELDAEHVAAIHRYLSGTAGSVLMVQIEDALGEIEQPNLPGTTDEHPNWKRRLPLDLDRIGSDAGLRELVSAVRAEGR